MTLSPGTRLGSYEIVSPIGAGGMGEVYRARDTKLKRDVAVKVLPQAVAADAERLGRFEREAHVLASLNHPHVASIYGLEDASGVPALIMELVEGESLAELVARGPVPVREALEFARQIAEALEYAHERGIVHRDLKPANIVISREGGVKVLDFGLAKAITGDTGESSSPDATHSPTLTSPATRAGVILGTAAYMSPEQARGKSVDRRADIWAFGVVLFEMLTGRRPFEGETVSDTIAAILTRAPAMDELPAATPASIRRLLERCLDRDAKQRLRDIGEARIALESATVQEAAAAGPAAAMRAKSSPLPWVVAGLAVAGALAWTLVTSKRIVPASEPIKYSQRTFRPQSILQALYTPDGQTIVYSSAPSGNTPYLFSLRPEYTEPLKMSEQPLHLLSISSTGELAVLTHPRWFAHRLCRGTLARMSPAGGAPREIMENVVQATWAPDGRELAIARDLDGVYRLEYPPGKVLFQTGAYISDLRFSPDGNYIAYFEHPATWDDRGEVVVINLEGTRKVLSEGYWGLEGIAWAHDSQTVYFSGGTGYADFSVYAASLDGNARIAAQSAGGLIIHDVSPAGEWLATRDDQSRMMMVRAPGSNTERDLSWQELSAPTRLSRDGRMLLFTESGTSAGNNYQVCMRGTDGSPVVVLGEGGAIDLTDDGRWALAGIFPSRLIMYPAGAGKAVELNTKGIARVSDARWVAGGKSVLIVGGPEGEAARCYLLDVAGGAPRALTAVGTARAFPSPDATRMLLADTDGKWWIAPMDSNASRVPVAAITDADGVAGWREDGAGVYVYDQSRVPSSMDFIDLDTGARRVAFALDPKQPALYIGAATVAAGESAYAYQAIAYVSRLYTVKGAR